MVQSCDTCLRAEGNISDSPIPLNLAFLLSLSLSYYDLLEGNP